MNPEGNLNQSTAEFEKNQAAMLALQDRFRQLSDRQRHSPESPKANVLNLCLSCAQDRAGAVLKKARGLPPGTKCDQCHGQAVMSLELASGV